MCCLILEGESSNVRNFNMAIPHAMWHGQVFHVGNYLYSLLNMIVLDMLTVLDLLLIVVVVRASYSLFVR